MRDTLAPRAMKVSARLQQLQRAGVSDFQVNTVRNLNDRLGEAVVSFPATVQASLMVKRPQVEAFINGDPEADPGAFQPEQVIRINNEIRPMAQMMATHPVYGKLAQELVRESAELDAVTEENVTTRKIIAPSVKELGQ